MTDKLEPGRVIVGMFGDHERKVRSAVILDVREAEGNQSLVVVVLPTTQIHSDAEFMLVEHRRRSGQSLGLTRDSYFYKKNVSAFRVEDAEAIEVTRYVCHHGLFRELVKFLEKAIEDAFIDATAR